MNGIEKVVTAGQFVLDGGSWDVDNNVWIVGTGNDVLIIDAAHDAAPIIEAVGERNVVAVLCTHGHNDHVGAAPELASHFGVPVLLHPGEDQLWRQTHPTIGYQALADGQRITVGDTEVEVILTPGHSPGSVCVYAPSLGALFSGDTLFQGGPGATGRSFSHFPTIIDSIRDRLLALPPETSVYTGHGDGTSIGAEAPHLEEWVTRGH